MNRFITPRCLYSSFSTQPSPLEQLQASLHDELTSRPATVYRSIMPNETKDLIDIAFAGTLPPDCLSPGFSIDRHFSMRNGKLHPIVTQGYHVAYFPPRITDADLLADGTDKLQWPGHPFVRRVWAGGSVVFHPHFQRILRGNVPSTLTEDITGVRVTGTEGNEKIWVTVRRKLWQRTPKEDTLMLSDTSGTDTDHVVETRNLVFMRERTEELDTTKETRIVKRNSPSQLLSEFAKSSKAIHTPDYSISITPTRHLLFRWSAITFNAHRIHLDPEYCREMEGYRNMLVHGPLCLFLMLRVLRSQLHVSQDEMIMSIDYKNLAPLYVDEPMKICIKKDENREDRYAVWIEGKDGGYAVKGTAVIGKQITKENKHGSNKQAKKKVAQEKSLPSGDGIASPETLHKEAPEDEL